MKYFIKTTVTGFLLLSGFALTLILLTLPIALWEVESKGLSIMFGVPIYSVCMGLLYSGIVGLLE